MTAPFDIFKEIDKETAVYLAGMREGRYVAGVQQGRPDEQKCWNCGTSENRFDECNGCRAARRQEARMDRDRGD